MKCIIVDDEEMAIKVLESHISKINSLEIVATHNNAMDAFSTIQKENIDLLFLDIQMPKLSGFGLLKTMPTHPHVIITTAHREFALESYDFTITDYLLKPISFERFLKTIGKIHQFEKKKTPVTTIAETASAEPSFFYIKSDRQFIKIDPENVLYIESLRNHVNIVTKEKNYTTLISITEMEEKLAPQHFLRIHRSFIVALSKIKQFTHTSVTINDKTLTIGNFYKKEVLKRLNQRLF